MSRTGEIVLTVIGAIIYGLSAIGGAFMVWLFNNEAVQNEAMGDINQQEGVGAEDMEAAFGFLQGGGWFLVALSVIGLILGIVCIVFLKGDKKPKAAGIILIVTSVLFAIITFGALIFSGIFYLIAGIMCLARKPPQVITE
ncbi:DUF4064 domain-containing protein [Lentibacillus salicampi]|uniref:DUF4064 domain-containing protein n=1 Tax=Lentibacillus salicampi TaxID=175306 RepID=A0A4Y9AAE5_9BACI|nr:DUF4064 domain-containing protein [Lentibacillus salicampi]TFJ91870.1 DUF4064 domain-containing protein [Lentibacillus salicampi]